jgi:hypothetical protein
LGAAELGTATPISVKNLTPKRRELLKWFQINCASLAEAYEGAIWLLEDQRFPGRVHFIAHAVRDIADRLIFVLDPQTESKRVQYEGEMDKIQKLWPKLDAIEEKSGELLGQDGVNIGRELAVRIDALVRAHCKRRERPSQYELLFRYLVRHEPNQGEVNQRLVFDFKKTRDWFMAFTHLRKDAAPQVNETELQTQFSNFVTCPTDGGRRNRYD